MFIMFQMYCQTTLNNSIMNNSKIKADVLTCEVMCTAGQSITIAIKDVFT